MKIFFLLALCASLAGCAAEVIDPNDDQAIVAEVEALGFQGADIKVDGNIIRVDRDIILYRDMLLNGDYAEVARTDDGFVEKGYRDDAIVTNGIGNIKLTWGVDRNAPTPTVRDAFIHAAGDFNSIKGSALRLSQKNSGPAIRINMIKAYWPTDTPCEIGAVACTDWPARGNPSKGIYIKSAPGDGCASWSTSYLALTARHELMHAIGMAHPLEGDHIRGTAPCAPKDNDCTERPNYATLMGNTPTQGKNPCDATPTVLQTDDRLSVRTLYPAGKGG
jgi:hypothetical protein